MKLGAAFPSKWLKSDDCEDSDLVLTVASARIENIAGQGQADHKLVLFFEEQEKGLICNKTNAKAIAKIHGDDTDDWIGKRIALYATEVEYAGETMLGIRVRLKAPKPAGKVAGQPRPAPAGAPVVADSDDEDIPF